MPQVQGGNIGRRARWHPFATELSPNFWGLADLLKDWVLDFEIILHNMHLCSFGIRRATGSEIQDIGKRSADVMKAPAFQNGAYTPPFPASGG